MGTTSTKKVKTEAKNINTPKKSQEKNYILQIEKSKKSQEKNYILQIEKYYDFRVKFKFSVYSNTVSKESVYCIVSDSWLKTWKKYVNYKEMKFSVSQKTDIHNDIIEDFIKNHPNNLAPGKIDADFKGQTVKEILDNLNQNINFVPPDFYELFPHDIKIDSIKCKGILVKFKFIVWKENGKFIVVDYGPNLDGSKGNKSFYEVQNKTKDDIINMPLMELRDPNSKYAKLKFVKINNNLIKNSNNNYYSNQSNNKLKQTLEHMCNYGNKVLKEIENDKKSIIKDYIYLDDLKYGKYSSDPSLFALNLLAQNLANNNIEAVIEKEPKNISEDEIITNLQFIVNGLSYKKKYTLSFDFGEENNEKILEKGDEYDKFIYELRQKISRDFGINPDDIIITYLERGSVKLQVIFQSDEFNELTDEEFAEKFKNENEFRSLRCLKTIHSDVIMGACKLSKKFLDPRGNRESGWGINEKRGNRPYNPPLGWIGIGLNVMEKYGDNTWIGMSNIPGEWCIAYHGVANSQPSDNVKDVTGKIIKGRFIKGHGQAHKNCPDKYHLGKKVGEGVYCTPNPGTAESYAGISEINGKKYKTILMVRVKPEAIRNCDKCYDSRNDNYWVVDGTTDEIRPYRILYKEC